jgi:hypothetical protein
MNWQPIETYDALKKKPKHAMFLFRRESRGGRGDFVLEQTIQPARIYGLRVCTHWIELPPPPSEQSVNTIHAG